MAMIFNVHFNRRRVALLRSTAIGACMLLAPVGVVSAQAGGVTDAKGAFSIGNIPAGAYVISANLPDGAIQSGSVSIPQTGVGNVALAPLQADAASADRVGVVTVTAARPGTLESALKEQQNAVSTTNVLSAQQIEQSPVTDVVDLAHEIPGLTAVTTGELAAATGEGQYLSIRGFDTGYNAYSLNGLRLPETDANSRAVSLNLFSPFGLQAISVDKTPTSDQDGDNIAGDINLRTPSAFDLGKKYFKLKTQGEFDGQGIATTGDGYGGAIELEAARTYNQRFGVYVDLYYEDKNVTSEDVAAQNNWVVNNRNLVGNARQNYSNLALNGVQWNYFENEINRLGGNISFDYHGESSNLYWRNIVASYTNFQTQDQASLRPGLANNPANGFSNADNPSGAALVQTNIPGTNGTYNTTTGAYQPSGIQPGHYFQYNEFDQALFSSELGGQTKLNSSLTTQYTASYSYGYFDTPRHFEGSAYGVPYTGNGANGAGGGPAQASLNSYNLSNPANPTPILSAAAASYLYNPNNLIARNDSQYEDYTKDGLLTLKNDWVWTPTFNTYVSDVQAGIKYENSNRDADDGQSAVTNFLNLYGVDSLSRVSPTATQGQGPSLAHLPGSFISGIFNYPGALQIANANYYINSFGPLEAAAPNNPAASALAWARLRITGDEARYAGYLEAHLNFGDLSVVPGVRYELNTDRFRSYNATNPGYDIVKKSYDEILPGVDAAYRPDKNLVFRLSIRQSYARPAFDQLYGTTQVRTDDFGNVTISEPNPKLKPVAANNYDFGAEYYDQHGGLLQAEVYYKQLSNVLYSIAAYNAGTGQASSTTTGNTTVTTTTNGLSGMAAGVELNARRQFRQLKAPFDGVGLAGNVTWQTTEGQYNSGGAGLRSGVLPSAPKLLYNLELFYEKYGLQANLNYHYQGLSLYQLQLNDPDVYLQPTASLNFSAAYTFSDGLAKGFKIGVGATNLLGSYTYWATEGTSTRYLASNLQGGYQEAGRTFLLQISKAFN